MVCALLLLSFKGKSSLSFKIYSCSSFLINYTVEYIFLALQGGEPKGKTFYCHCHATFFSSRDDFTPRGGRPSGVSDIQGQICTTVVPPSYQRKNTRTQDPGTCQHLKTFPNQNNRLNRPPFDTSTDINKHRHVDFFLFFFVWSFKAEPKAKTLYCHTFDRAPILLPQNAVE